MKYFLALNSSLNHDFCPWANDYVYWLKKPIGWVVLAFSASILLGVCVSNQAFLASAAIFALGVVGVFWPWIAMFGMQGRLSWHQLRCEEGEKIRTTLSLLHRWPWPAWGIVVEADDAIASHVEAPGESICLSRVPAASKSDFEWQCQPSRRGCYPMKEVRLSTGFPFGIWTAYRTLTVTKPLVVWPKLFKLVDVPSQPGSRCNGIGTVTEQTGDEGDWMGVRPFRPGDSLRQVHWAQTARRESLVVFERQTRSRQGVSISFDSVAARATQDSQREWMVRILASLTNHFMSHSWQVQAQFDSSTTYLTSNQTSKQKWMDRLAGWDAHAEEMSDAETKAASKTSSVALKFIISTPESALAQWRSLPKVERAGLTWVLVTSNEEEQHRLDTAILGSQIVINVDRQPISQLQLQWQRLCQRSSRTKVGAEA